MENEKEDGVEHGARAGEGRAWDVRGNPSPSGPPSNNCDSLFVAVVLWLASHAVTSERAVLALSLGMGSRSVSGGGEACADAPRSAAGDFFNLLLSKKK